LFIFRHYYQFANPFANSSPIIFEAKKTTRLTSTGKFLFAASPDGKQIAFYFTKAVPGKFESGIALMSFETGETIKTFNVQADSCQQCRKMNSQWATDKRAIFYVKTEKGLSNSWQQPINGSAPVQVTDFTTDRIFNFAFSPDGSQLALSHGTIKSDVVLIGKKYKRQKPRF
jgi:Tol biopolymer transport system component